MSLDNLSAQIAAQDASNKSKIPPVELWDPPYCGEIDIQIKTNGDWFYGGTIFKRMRLVKLFASVLKKEDDDYFLVTPVEKVKIKVDDVPFVITQWSWQDEEKTNMLVSSNLGDEFVLNDTHPLKVTDDGDFYITVRRNLLAKVHRNVYYQWVDLGQEIKTKKGTELVFFSAKHQFSLGVID